MLYHVVLSFCGGWVVVPSDYFVSTQLQLWLFCCWGCGCCSAVTTTHSFQFFWPADLILWFRLCPSKSSQLCRRNNNFCFMMFPLLRLFKPRQGVSITHSGIIISICHIDVSLLKNILFDEFIQINRGSGPCGISLVH